MASVMGGHQASNTGLSGSRVHAGAQEMLVPGTAGRGVGVLIDPRRVQIGRQIP